MRRRRINQNFQIINYSNFFKNNCIIKYNKFQLISENVKTPNIYLVHLHRQRFADSHYYNSPIKIITF